MPVRGAGTRLPATFALAALAVGCASPAGPRAVRPEPAPAYHLAGEYFETSSCPVGCPCIYGGDAKASRIDGIAVFHVVRGRVGEIDVSGATVALTFSAAGPNLAAEEGRWIGAVYVDAHAPAPAREAAARAFLARFGPLYGRLEGPTAVPMKYRKEGDRRWLRIGPEASLGSFEIEGLPGRDGRPVVVENAPKALAPVLYVGRGLTNRYDEPALGRSWRYEGRSAYYGAFEYRSP